MGSNSGGPRSSGGADHEECQVLAEIGALPEAPREPLHAPAHSTLNLREEFVRIPWKIPSVAI